LGFAFAKCHALEDDDLHRQVTRFLAFFNGLAADIHRHIHDAFLDSRGHIPKTGILIWRKALAIVAGIQINAGQQFAARD
jgi:hypothetical protein